MLNFRVNVHMLEPLKSLYPIYVSDMLNLVRRYCFPCTGIEIVGLCLEASNIKQLEISFRNKVRSLPLEYRLMIQILLEEL